ncbi:unnamed protein product [Owenia fusiformis]|uniref:Uncharacterized protein n=1 Tax=Owenia fusiformis TaxID=6347 RepID=A0A8S4NIX5_OWEFU|nr:unnamed protein product [Owenia fusiformis]
MATRHKSFSANRPRSRESQRSGLTDGHRSRLQEVQNTTGFYSGRALPKDTEDTIQVLNLTGNQIEHIPVWLAKRLKSLRIFRCAKNNIGSFSEISKLRPLQDLSQVSFAENPVTKVPHYRSFVIFQLRTLDILDGQPISNEEREAAQNRFSQDELEHLEKIISEQEEKLSTLEDQHNKSLHEVTVRQEEQKTWKKQQKEKEKQLEEMRNEMKAKDDLLKRKTMELTKACEKNYELEQELAFFKIDSKFGSLGQVPPTYDMEDYDGENDLIGESPYIGRARYQKNQYAFEKNLAPKGQPIRIQQLAGSSDIGASPSFLRDSPQQADQSTGLRW